RGQCVPRRSLGTRLGRIRNGGGHFFAILRRFCSLSPRLDLSRGQHYNPIGYVKVRGPAGFQEPQSFVRPSSNHGPLLTPAAIRKASFGGGPSGLGADGQTTTIYYRWQTNTVAHPQDPPRSRMTIAVLWGIGGDGRNV